jgi:hypothetical protein
MVELTRKIKQGLEWSSCKTPVECRFCIQDRVSEDPDKHLYIWLRLNGKMVGLGKDKGYKSVEIGYFLILNESD